MRTDPMGKFCHPEKRSVVGQCEGVCRSIAFVRDDALYGKSKTPSEETLTGFLVPRTGIEPARLAAHAPETCASTYSATWAFLELRCAKVILFSETPTLFSKKIYLLKNLC